MPGFWCLLLLPLGAATSNFSSEVVVSSQALRVRGGEPPERAEVRPMPRASRAVPKEEVEEWRPLSAGRNGPEESSPSAKVQESNGQTETPEDTNQTEPDQGTTTLRPDDEEVEEGRGHMKKMKKQFKKIAPYLMIPGFMALGYAPFILASLKMFVMNALTLNMMAFNAAIFITLRNMVFGPRKDEHIKYYNFGYKKKHDHHHHHHPHGR